MMRRILSVVLGTLALGLFGARAQIWTFNTTLTADQEVPPTSSPATGVATGTQMFASGAIRGQIFPVPEPASLLALSAGLLVCLRRRRVH